MKKSTFKIKNPILRWFAGLAVVLVCGALVGIFLYYTGLLLEPLHFWFYELPYGRYINKTSDIIFFGFCFWSALLIGVSVVYIICILSKKAGDRFFNKIAEEAARTAGTGD